MFKKQICIFLVFISSLFSFDVQKPQIYDQQDISGWVMSEKLDGIRGYWDGEELYTKNGNRINTPVDFTKNFPPFALDGELYSFRGDFENIQATILDKKPSSYWTNITYNIFEAPNAQGDFLIRLNKVKKWFDEHPNRYVKIVEQKVCKDEEQLTLFLEKIVSLNGEGVIVKDPTLNYHTGRSPHILKVKKAQDMEGMVIGHNYRKDGRTLKSLKIKLHNGVVFNLGGGFSDKQRLNPPKIGVKITFKFYNFTKNGKPKFASFLRIREKE